MTFLSTLRSWSPFGRSATSQVEGMQDGNPSGYPKAPAAPVTETTALQVSEVWSCVRLLAETFACLPVSIFDRKQPGVDARGAESLRYVLTISPNARMTCVEFYETMQVNLTLHGNAYALIQKNGAGNIVALWPIGAETIRPFTLEDGTVVYQHRHGSDVTVYPDADILHIKLFGNGTIGLSPLGYARNSIGLATASDGLQSDFYINGGKPTGIIYTQGNLNRAQRKEVADNFAEVVSEREYEKRLVILPGGDKYESTQLSPADLELLEARRFTTSQILRFMGNIPGPLVGHYGDSTVWGSGIEQIFLAWYRTGLNPYASRWEQAIEKKLMKPKDRVRWKVEFNFDALLRGDSKTQAEVIKSLVGGPVKTPNEGREIIGLPPVEGGDKLNPSPTHSKLDTQVEQTANA